MSFEEQYSTFMAEQMNRSRGERLRRLQGGLGYAERMFLEHVWWPAFGGFEHLHAEYEVDDYKNGTTRFLDFAYLRPPYRVCLEIDGYGTHIRDISRSQYSDHNRRQNLLIYDDWKVYRFTYDDIKDRPRMCQMTLQQVIGKYYGSSLPEIHLSVREKEIVQLFIHIGGPLTPSEVAKHLQLCTKQTRRHLKGLVLKNILKSAASGQLRVRAYT